MHRSEIWGVLLAMQGQIKVHIGIHNLSVVNHVSAIISTNGPLGPFLWLMTVILLLHVQRMVKRRGPGNSRATKVKSHADEVVVAMGHRG